VAVEDLVQAVREGLAAYLAAQLAAAYPTLMVYREWPPKNATAEYTISVLTAGDGEYEYHPPEVISVTPDVSPAVTGAVTYSYGRCEDLPLQLELWATAPFKRDQLMRDVRRLLNQPASATLGTGVVDLPHEPGLVLPIAGLAGQPADFEFTPTLGLPENSDATETNEWRASWRGSARFSLVEQQANVVLRKRLVLQIGAGQLLTFTNPRETRTAQGVTLRVVPGAPALTRPGFTQLRVSATFQGGMVADVTKLSSFASDNPIVAGVNQDGRVLAGATAGTANITVSYAGFTVVVVATVS